MDSQQPTERPPACDVDRVFTYHRPSGDQPERYERLRAAAKELAITCGRLCPESRELSLARTKIEEAVFWANAAVARHAERLPPA